jgi:putative SOS response-associated peptidase YedK
MAPSQDLLVIRRNHQTGEVSLDPLRWGLIPYCYAPNTMPQTRPQFAVFARGRT